MDKIIAITREKKENITVFKIFYIKTVKQLFKKSGHENGYFMRMYLIDTKNREISKFSEKISKRRCFYEILEATEKNLLSSVLSEKEIEKIYQSCFKHWYK